MERISKEIIISTLFTLGFEKVDNYLYGFALGKISEANTENKVFRFSDEDFSGLFNEVVDYDNGKFCLKDGLSLNSNMSSHKDEHVSLRRLLNTNIVLYEFLRNLDYKEMVLNKMFALKNDTKDYSNYFCEKEKNIISEMFGLHNTKEKKKSMGRVLIPPKDL